MSDFNTATDASADLLTLFQSAVHGRYGVRLAFLDKQRANVAADRLSPSYVLHGPQDSLHLVYLVADEGERLEAIVDEVRDDEDDDAYVEFDVVEPDAKEYHLHEDDAAQLVSSGAFEVVTVDEIEAKLFPPVGPEMVADTLPTPSETRYNADFYGDWNPETRDLVVSLSKPRPKRWNGKSTSSIKSKEWVPVKPMTIEALCDEWFDAYRVGAEKDDGAFFPGELSGAQKTGPNVKSLCMGWVDNDDGTLMSDTTRLAFQSGLFFIVQPTHNFGTTQIPIHHDKYGEWCVARGGKVKGYDPNDPTVDAVKEYLRENSIYLPPVIDGVKSAIVDQVDGGWYVLVETIPIEKHRIGFVFEKPVLRKDYLGRDKELMLEWSEKLRGLGLLVGVKVDESTLELNRGFYKPSRREDATPPNIVINRAGRAAKWEELERVPKPSKQASDPFAAAADDMVGRDAIIAPGGTNLNKWAFRDADDRADYFDIVKAFNNSPMRDEIVFKDEGDEHMTVMCPIGKHSPPKGVEFDPGCWIASAGGYRDNMDFRCSHQSCKAKGGDDRLVMLCEAINLGWIDESLLYDNDYDRKGDREATGAARVWELVDQISELGKKDAGLLAQIAAEVAKLPVEDAVDIAVGDALEGSVGLGKRQWGNLIKAARDKNDSAKAKAAREAALKPTGKKDVVTSEMPPPAQREAAIVGLRNRNSTTPRLFESEGIAKRLKRNRYGVSFEEMGWPELIYEFGEAVTFLSINEKVTEEHELPETIVRHWMGAPTLGLPVCGRISKVPFHAPDGSLHLEDGYAESIETLFDIEAVIDEIMKLGGVPENPSRALVAESRSLILDDAIVNFPFSDAYGNKKQHGDGRGSRANAVAMILDQFVRGLVEGNKPYYLIDKPNPGTGAGYCADVMFVTTTGRRGIPLNLPKSEEELEKRLGAVVVSAPPVVYFDNANEIDSGALAAFTTAENYSFRPMSKSHLVTLPILCQIIVTGNKLKLSIEQRRRAVPIYMVAPRATKRTKFKHDHQEFLRDNRAALVRACLIIVQNWIALGRPEPLPRWGGRVAAELENAAEITKGAPDPALTMPSFEHYATVMGGILDAAGIHGFLSNLDAFNEAKADESEDSETEVWQAIWDSYGTDAKNMRTEGFKGKDHYSIGFLGYEPQFACLVPKKGAPVMNDKQFAEWLAKCADAGTPYEIRTGKKIATGKKLGDGSDEMVDEIAVFQIKKGGKSAGDKNRLLMFVRMDDSEME